MRLISRPFFFTQRFVYMKNEVKKRSLPGSAPYPRAPRKRPKIKKLNPSDKDRKKYHKSKRDLEICQRLLDAHPDIALMIEKEGRIIAGNRFLCTGLGCDLTDILNKSIFDFFPEEVAKKRKAAVESAVSTGNSLFYRDCNNNRFFEHHITPLRDPQGDITCLAVFTRDITHHAHAEESVKLLSWKLMSTIEEERKKIACDLHDKCGQLVTVVSMGLHSLKEGLPEEMEGTKLLLANCIRLIAELGDKIRTISSGIHPDMIDNLGLAPAIEWYLETYFKNIAGIHYEFKTNCKDKNLGHGIDIALYRIIQESLNNVIRHARARNVLILLEAENRVVRLKIQDDGVGFTLEEALPFKKGEGVGMGLLSMRERAASIGGRLLIQTSPGKGTAVIVTLSVRKEGGDP